MAGEPPEGPSFIQVSAVESVLRADSRISGMLSPATVRVLRRDGFARLFPPETITVMEALIADGLSPKDSPASSILNVAAKILSQRPEPAVESVTPTIPVKGKSAAKKVPSGAPSQSKLQDLPGVPNHFRRWAVCWTLIENVRSLSAQDPAPGADDRTKRLAQLGREFEALVNTPAKESIMTGGRNQAVPGNQRSPQTGEVEPVEK